MQFSQVRYFVMVTRERCRFSRVGSFADDHIVLNKSCIFLGPRILGYQSPHIRSSADAAPTNLENLSSSLAFIFQSKLGLSSVIGISGGESTKLYEDLIENCILLEILNWKSFPCLSVGHFLKFDTPICYTSKIRYF